MGKNDVEIMQKNGQQSFWSFFHLRYLNFNRIATQARDLVRKYFLALENCLERVSKSLKKILVLK